MINELLSQIAFDPLLPWLWVIVITGIAVIAALFAATTRLRSDFQRLLAALFLGLALSGPQLVSEDRKPLPDTRDQPRQPAHAVCPTASDAGTRCDYCG